MKSSSFRIIFIIQKNKAKANGKAPLYARITVNNHSTSLYLRTDIDPERWLGKDGRTVGLSREEKQINALIDDFRILITKRYQEMLFRGEVVTVSKLKQAILTTDARCVQFIELCDKFNEDYYQMVLAGSVTRCTYIRYLLTRTRLAEYIKHKYKMNDIPLQDVNQHFIKGLDLWLRNKKDSSNNTAVKFIQRTRTIFNMALHNGWVHTDPYANYKMHFDKTDRGFLTKDELERIQDKEITNKRLEIVRDAFVFCCYTGFAYIDARELTKNNIQVGPDGKTWLVTKRQKTKVPVRIRLLEMPRLIIDKYKGQGKLGRLLPMYSNQKMNDYLKEIAAICDINKYLTFHLARHTFATTVTLANGVPIETVSKMHGHTSIKTTQIYARITDMKVSDDMELLAQKLEGVTLAGCQ